MYKNSKKTISSSDKYTISQQDKLNNSHKFPDIFMTNNESFTFLHHTKNIFNIFSNYYAKKDENNIKINNFLEKICLLNKQFYANGEKAILAKTSYEKLYDDLFKNLFKQIDFYIEEIQRLNKKIISINSKDNFKEIIKKLNKEINKNKNKIQNYENIIKEKNIKEEKLNKEIEYYKRRVIFFKNKININLISKNINTRNSYNILASKLKAEKNSNSNKKIKHSYKSTSYKYKNKKQYSYLTPSPLKLIRKNNNLIYINPTNNSTVFDRRKLVQEKLYYSNLNDFSNNDLTINKHLITVNVDKFRKFFPEKETTNSSSKKIIKLNKNISKENLFPNNNITVINKNNIIKKNINEENLDEKKNDNYEIFSPYNYLEDNLNLYSNNEKNNSETIIKYNSYNSNLKNANTCRKRSDNIKSILKENRNNDLNEKNFENTSYFSSNIDLNTYRKNIISKTNFINNSSKNKTVKIYTTNRMLKTLDIKQKLNLNRQNSLNINTNYNKINSPRRNTINGINKTNINNNKSKNNQLNNEDIESIKKKYYFKIINYNNKKNYNDNNIIKSNVLDKDSHNILKDIILNTEKNDSDNNLKCIQKTDKKLKYKNKLSCINFPSKIKNTINVNKKNLDKGIKTEIYNKNEIIKVLKEINEDYNNNIEMLNYQENEIKFLLKLIDSNEE